MTDIEPISSRPAGEGFIQPGGNTVSSAWPQIVSFNRSELNQILTIYGRRVAEGEWRDYAIDMLRDRAVFSIFRRSTEAPLYRIEKNPKLSRRQGAYSVVSATGLILKRGHELGRVLRVFDNKKFYVVET